MDSKTTVYYFDDIVAEPGAFKISKSGQPVQLEPKAFEVLTFLIENRGRLIEKDELLNAVWKDAFVTQNAMTRVIAQLRKALGDDAREARYIETVPTRGYRFIATVQIKTDPELAESQETVETSTAALTKNDHVTDSRMATVAESPSRRFTLPQIVAVVSLIGVILIAAIVLWKRTSHSETTGSGGVVRTTQITTWTGLDLFPAISPDGNSIAYSSDHQGGFEIYIKSLTPGARELQITSDGKQNFQPAWSPDGKFLAYNSRDRSGIWIVPTSGGVPRQLVEFGARPAWSPDGSQIAFQSIPTPDLGASARIAMPPSTIWIVPVSGGAPKILTQTGNPVGGHGSPSWSHDGRRILFCSGDWSTSSVWWISVDGSQMKRVVAGAEDATYSPNDDSVYFVGPRYNLYKIRLSPDTGEPIGGPITVAAPGSTNIRFMSISADGKKLAYSAETSVSNLWSQPISPTTHDATGPPAVLAPNTKYRNAFPTFSPDGSKVAFDCWQTTTRGAVWIMDPDGKDSTQLTTGDGHCQSWFPGGNRIAFLSVRDGHTNLYSVELDSRRETPLLEFGESTEFARMSPDGKLVAFNSKRNGVPNISVIPIEGGQARQLTFEKEQGSFPSWSKDGKFIAYQARTGDDTNVFVIPRDGGPSTQLTFSRGQHWTHDWSSDNDKICYARFHDGVWNVWWVSRSTKEEKQVTNYTKLNAYVRYPAWSPRGNQIVYEYTETTGNIWLMELK